MGYYIEVPRNKEKAEQLVALHGGEIIAKPDTFDKIPQGKALICIVDNGFFEAAGYCFDSREFSAFAYPDGRPRKWVLMSLKKAEKLSGYTNQS